MKILVVSATAMETAIFSEQLKSRLINTEHTIEILITGIGAANTMYHLLKKINSDHFDLVIQAGIAGTFTEHIALGEVMLVESDSFGDLGMEEDNHFQTIFQAGFAEANDFPFIDGLLKNDNGILKNSSLKSVSASTVNKVTDNVFQKQQLINTFNPSLESMEGAAFHYVCLMEKIPFVQIRAVSNYVGDRNKANWKFKESISALNNELIKIVDELVTKK